MSGSAKTVRKRAAPLAASPATARSTTTASAKPTVAKAPETFTYRLAPYIAELRATGWFISKAEPSFAGNKVEWVGPYVTIDNATAAIARRLMVEVTDRHTKMIECYGFDRNHRLYGLKRTHSRP